VKITEQSESRFVAQRSPYNQMAMGALFIVAGASVAVSALRHGSVVAMLVCLAFTIFGAYWILAAKRVTIVAERSSATVSVAWRSLLGSGERSANIADIDRIRYREFTSTERTEHGRRTTREDTSMLVLKDGSTVLLDKEQTSVRGWLQTLGASSDEAVDTALSDFIGVPFVANGITHTPITPSQSAATLRSEQAWDEALAPPATGGPATAPPAAVVPAAAPPATATAPAPTAPATAAPATSAPAAAQPATAAPPLARPATPLTGPGSSPYWDSTPPPWARSK
jgi:hypothetical protein